MHRLALTAGLVLALPLGAADWPQWQGIDRSAVSKEKGLLQAWPKDGPKLLWKATGCGEGYSTPSVADGKIYLMGNRAGKEWVIALAEPDGKELWAVEVGKVRSNGGNFPGPRCCPTVDGKLVYALGLNGDLLCIDTAAGGAAGAVKWRKDLRKDFGGRVGGWEYSESPLIDGDKVIVTPGGEEAGIVALNKLTGEVVWKARIPQKDQAHYSSAIVAEVHGVRQYIQFMSGGVVGIAAKDGSFLWRYDAPANGTANCSSPIYHDGHVFAASAYGTGGGLAKLTKTGDAWKAEQVYFTKKMQNHHGGMILVDGKLYGSNEGQLTCLDFLKGDVLWAERCGKGSIAAADGRIYYRDESGPMLLADLTPTKYTERGRFDRLGDSGKNTWPHPVVANGRLYLRDQDTLLCYDIKGP